MSLPAPHDRLLIPVYLPSAFTAIANQAMLLLLPLYALEVSGSAAFAALVMAMRGIGVLLFDVPAGLLIGRFGDKSVLLGGLLTLAASMFGLSLATEQWLIALLSIPLGAAHAAWFLGWLTYITHSCPPEMRGQATAVNAGVQRLGALAGPLVGGIIAESLGYPAAYLGAAAFCGAAFLISLLFTADVRPHAPARSGHLKTIGGIFADNRRVFATAGSVAFVFQLVRATRQLLVPLFGVTVGLEPAAIGLIYAIAALVDVSLSYPVGIAMDRWGRKWTGVPSIAAFVIGLAMLPFAQGFWTLLAAALMLGVGNGLSTGLIMIIGLDLSPLGQRGQFLGVWRLIGDVGWASGPLLAGLLLEAFSLAAASLFAGGLGVLGGLMLLFFVPETSRISRERESSTENPRPR